MDPSGAAALVLLTSRRDVHAHALRRPIAESRHLGIYELYAELLWNGGILVIRGRMRRDITITVGVTSAAHVEEQDVEDGLADLVTKEQTKIPQLGILALALDEKLLSMLPPLRNRFGVVLAGKETYGGLRGRGAAPGRRNRCGERNARG